MLVSLVCAWLADQVVFLKTHPKRVRPRLRPQSEHLWAGLARLCVARSSGRKNAQQYMVLTCPLAKYMSWPHCPSMSDDMAFRPMPLLGAPACHHHIVER